MQQRLISCATQADSLIVFANGWGMTPDSVAGLLMPPYTDLLHLWDYRTTDWDGINWDAYRSVYWVAWSMGVWFSELFFRRTPTLHLTKAIAVAGTPRIVHNDWGIPVGVYEATLRMLTPESREKFNRRMCGGKNYAHLFEVLRSRSTEEIKQELEMVYRKERQIQEEQSLPTASGLWNEVHIGTDDLIIPYKNQIRYWDAVPEAEKRVWQGGAHYLFDRWKSWDDLLNPTHI